MEKILTIRHDGLVPEPLLQSEIYVIGCGGVGSNVVEPLARMQLGQSGVTLYDGDTVEAHNPPSQKFNAEHIGMKKVDALYEQARIWSDNQIKYRAVAEMVENYIPLSGVVFLCLDSMMARRNIMRQSLFNNPKVSLVVETRMDATLATIFTIDPNNASHQACWEAHWFTDDEAENQRGCNGHYAIPTATNITGALAVQQALNYFDDKLREMTPNLLMLNLHSWRTTTRLWPKMLLTE